MCVLLRKNNFTLILMTVAEDCPVLVKHDNMKA